MQTRLAVCCATLAALLLGVLATPAVAGGWAVTTLDALPAAGFASGQTYAVGFTIRQHGATPYNQATPRLLASQGRTSLTFPATRDGDGHYVARVEFPAYGVWTWEVDQAPFARQALGTVEVVAAAAASAPAASEEAGVEQALPGYVLAGALALLVLVWRRPLSAPRVR